MEQLAAQSSQRRLRDDSATRNAHGQRLTRRTETHGAGAHACAAFVRYARTLRLKRVASFLAASLFIVAAFLFSIATRAEAQSGRRTASPSATPAPNTQRPRRATPTRAADNIPGQPATPDAPSTTIAPTPTPGTDAPRTQSNDATTPAAAAAPATDDAAVEIDDGEIVRVTSNLVPVSATVTDPRGKAVTDLTVDDFELRVDGQPKPIGGLSHAETPVRIVMLFDNSKSIRASREFEKQAAIRFFKSVLRPVDQAAIYSVETLFSLEQPLTSDVSKLVRTIENFPEPEGATKLLDAIAHAAEYLRLVPGRKVIVIVSDGTDTVSDMTFDETLRRVIAADCQVYSVQTGVFENANLTDLMANRRLEIFSDRTGGAVYTPKTSVDLNTAFAQISADLAQQYILSYYPTDERNDNRFRVINLRVKTRPDLRVRARRGYYPRRNPQQLSSSSVSENFVSEAAARNEPPSDLNPPLTMPRELAVRAPRSTITFGGPAHGSKNMNPDTSGDSQTRNETDVRVVSPASTTSEANSNPNPAPRNNESPPGLKPEPPGAKTAGASPPPQAGADAQNETQSTPTPAPAQTDAPARTTETNAQQPSTQTTPQSESSSSQSSSSQSSTAPSQSPAAQEARQANSQTAPKTLLNVGQLNARAISLPKPLYPPMGKQMRVEGVVRVVVVVDEAGRVVSARAETGHVMLQNAAVSAARLARFKPTLVSGQPVPVSGFITYTFTL